MGGIMTRGPAPMPTKMKLITGNRGKRPINENEPEPKVEIPRKPKTLQGVAAEEWYRITPELSKLGLLTKIDRVALELYCQLYSYWVDACSKVKSKGMVIESENGGMYQNPYLGIANKCTEKMHKMLCEFGMTPASRSRIKVELPKQEESFDI